MRIGIDVGGTFTDLVGLREGRLIVEKVPSTPPAFEAGVLAALQGVPETQGDAPHSLVHGSTVATNALLERKGPPVALVASEGFTDILHLARQNRPQLYDLHPRKPRPVIGRENCFEIPERLAADGSVLAPLDEQAVQTLAEELKQRGIDDVAVCLLFSFIDPTHERRVGQILDDAGLRISLSSHVAPEFREYERASTTAITALLRPTLGDYLGNLSRALAGKIDRVAILHGGGGTYPLAEAAQHAGRMVLSGPAGGVAGAAFIARSAGIADAVSFDMGGTSTDVALISGGAPATTPQLEVDGLPIRLPMFDIHTIGAGGGSIAFRDAGGALRVGPRSAGAVPGPACYGRGGTEPTVTDANLLLGRIAPDASFGSLQLREDLARSAVDGLAAELGLSPDDTAHGIVRVAENQMAEAVRHVTARRGVDPRDLALISFGGAGGLHACGVAELLGMRRVILPPYAGVLSAMGMVVAPELVEQAQTTLQIERTGALDDDRLYAEFGRLNARAMDELPADRTARIEAFADCRWRGQSHELTVPASRPTRQVIEAAFREAYHTLYGPEPPGAALEIVALRLRRIGPTPEVTLPPLETGPDPGAGGFITRSTLLGGGALRGSFILVDPDATAFVPAGWECSIEDNGIILLSRAGGES